jgi:CCR4-NOT transcriptional regulation complex NOT5 subunit
VLRLLENEQVAAEEVEAALHDGLEYYLEAATEPDFQQAGFSTIFESMCPVRSQPACISHSINITLAWHHVSQYIISSSHTIFAVMNMV